MVLGGIATAVAAVVGGGFAIYRKTKKRAALIRELRMMQTMGHNRSGDPWVIGKYRVLKKLGTGGMAKVYLAANAQGNLVALKVPDPQFFQTEEHRTYFRQELSVGKKMQHPNVVRILDYADGAEGMPYIAMEYVDGVTLDKKLPRKRPVSLDFAAIILSRVSAALEYAHNMGVIHRDIKPENIMISRDGEVKVTDFGIARDLWDPPRATGDGNTFVGSPHYMSPEQISTEKVDYRTDYYSIGVLAFRLMTGYLPFEGETTLEVITRKVSQLPPPPSTYNQDIPLELEQLIRELMQREPERRPVSALPIRKIFKKFVPKSKKRHTARSGSSVAEDF